MTGEGVVIVPKGLLLRRATLSLPSRGGQNIPLLIAPSFAVGRRQKRIPVPSSLPTDSLKRLFLGCKNLPLRGHGITQPGKTFLRHIVLFPFSPETEPLSPYQMDGFLPHSLFSCSRSQVSCSRTNDPRGRIPREQTLCREIRTTIPPTQTMETPSITTHVKSQRF